MKTSITASVFNFCFAALSITETPLVSNAQEADTKSWKPVENTMMTEWGSKVTPENTWQEYPRPQFVRSDWNNLNGLWSYAVTKKDTSEKTHLDWNGTILVPFCPESALSGVGRLIEPNELLWYKRSLPGPVADKRTILHFEAVDYDATVFVNGIEQGRHIGGQTPFSFDITDSLQADGNELVVKISDATEGYQLHGKQNLVSKGIWYTRVTGIWQTVWTETVSPSYIADVDYECDIKSGSLTVKPSIVGSGTKTIRIVLSLDGTEIGIGKLKSDELSRGYSFSISISNPKLWSPESPTLYDVKLELLGASGEVVDSVQSYTAFREFGRTVDEQGRHRLTLNGKVYFHWGPLDQGWWPDGLLTPPSDAAMTNDIDYLKAAGFNMIRKHIKVEPRRYYHHCDKIGILIWQDQVSNGTGQKRKVEGTSPAWTRLAPNPVDATWPAEAHQQWIVEYKRMVEHLRDAPCIAAWVPYNEAWGQHATMEVGKLAVELDKTRAINIASGGNFWPIGDIADEHRYPHPGFPLDDKRFDPFVKVVGEFGGHGWPVEGHLWLKTDKNWGYGGLPKTFEEWKQRYAQSIRILNDLRKQGIAAGVYTQTTDVEVEINGLRTYDRKVDKIDPIWLKEQASVLFE
jgi:beta-galactosidase